MIEVSVVHRPVAVRSQGQTHVSYELRILNRTTEEVRFESITLDIGGVKHVFEGEALKAVSSRLAGKWPVMPAQSPALVWLDGKTAGQFGTRSVITQTFKVSGTLEGRAVTQEFSQSFTGVRTTTLSLGSPFAKGDWIAMNAYSPTSIHRRATQTVNGEFCTSQRYAVDWLSLGEEGTLFTGDPSNNRNWHCYGAEVLAVADGTVVAAKDGIPENVPLTKERAVPIDLETVGGNFVAHSLPQGKFAVYAHLVPGSLKVKVGAKVKRGDVLGRLGNSGNSDAPHLHFHVSDRPSVLGAQGEPYHFSSFQSWPADLAWDPFLPGKGWSAQGKKPRVVRHELPGERDIVRFGP